MTVGELMAKLQDFPSDLTVLVPAYEYGFDSLGEVSQRDGFKRYRALEGWHGDYGQSDSYQDRVGTLAGDFHGDELDWRRYEVSGFSGEKSMNRSDPGQT